MTPMAHLNSSTGSHCFPTARNFYRRGNSSSKGYSPSDRRTLFREGKEQKQKLSVTFYCHRSPREAAEAPCLEVLKNQDTLLGSQLWLTLLEQRRRQDEPQRCLPSTAFCDSVKNPPTIQAINEV